VLQDGDWPNYKELNMSRIKYAVVFALAVGGCSIEGKWNMQKIEPTAAVRDFEFTVLTLQKDGTYYAERTDVNRTTSGTYTFNGEMLILREHGGEVLTYVARLSPDGKTLELARGWRDRDIEAKFGRES
jgi:hypothetical protein